jgi:hypothetical protein
MRETESDEQRWKLRFRSTRDKGPGSRRLASPVAWAPSKPESTEGLADGGLCGREPPLFRLSEQSVGG